MEVEERATGSDFGSLLRRHRQAAGLSQEALAERARMSSHGVSALERGLRRTPQRETLTLLAGALGLSSEQRLEFETAAARPSVPRAGSMTVGPWPDTRAADLPLLLNSFVGRETELQEIAALVREHRLITLTGTGGIGKTQTALQVATALRDSADIEVSFVGLAPVGDPLSVTSAIASTLGVREAHNELLLDKLAAYLKHKTLLLVLDNCEHLIQEVARVAEALLATCQNLRILATSREPLRAGGEYSYRIPSLSVPPPELRNRLQAKDAAEYAALALFCDRARAIDHRFAIVDENVSVVADICARVDGIPLCIELAAARVNALSLEALAEKLNDRFAHVTGTRAMVPRQQTMAATIEWSYNLLTSRERRLFERLSVFGGGCTLGMALSVCSDQGQDETELLELISSLVDKSLVVPDFSAEKSRYVLLETTRQYARDRLAERGESDAFADRLARALLQLSREIAANQAIYNARLDRSPEALRAMRAEGANFDEAMQWAIARQADPRLGQELAWRVPFLRATDALRWLSLALDEVDEKTPSSLAIRLQVQFAWCCIDLRAHEKAVEMARRAVDGSRNLGDAQLLAVARRLLGRALTHAWKLDEAESELQQALTYWRESGDRPAIATTLSYLGFVAFRRGAYSHARRLNLEALEALRDSDERHARLIKIELARAEYGLGHHGVALAYSREVLPDLEAEAAEGGLTCVILMLNQCTFLLGLDRFDEAREVALRALTVTLDVRNPRPDLAPYVAGMLAKVTVLHPNRSRGITLTERLERCIKLIGWNEAACAARGESDPDETLEELTILRQEVGEERVEALLKEGASLDHGAATELMRAL
jgi:predicted ATPase/transcriptional regulator with XRE-family HTH domain